MAHDLVIRGGTLIDGTGGPARIADVAIDGDRVTTIGQRPGDVDCSRATQVIEADGLLVTPGFVDLHSHLDAQIGWDPTMSSSCWHGVTSVVMGNCGMTFAPVRDGQAETLATAMESVEDIPASCILAGLPWNWNSYGGYLDALEAIPRGLNAGGYVGDVAIRLYVAGDAACEPDFHATAAQLAEMAQLVRSSLCDGAFGYSLSRSLFHRVPDGRNVPGTWSQPSEFFAVAAPLAELGRGILESAPRYNEPTGSIDRVAVELAWMAELSRRTGRPFTFNLQQISSLGDHYLDVMRLALAENRRGAQLRPQITPRSVGVLFSLGANTLIDDLASWSTVAPLDFAARLDALRDPGVRSRLIEEGMTKSPEGFDRMYVMNEAPARYDYTDEDSLGALARRRNVSVVEAYIDLLVETNGAAIVNWPVMNQRDEAIEQMIASPVTVMGLADAGAHATQIMDASQPTWFLSHWARDRQVISLEAAVAKLTSSTADLIGYRDRGRLLVGSYADVNVIDLDALSLELPVIAHDFPGDAPRFTQRARGIRHTIVNGRPFMENGNHTGELVGRILRSTVG